MDLFKTCKRFTLCFLFLQLEQLIFNILYCPASNVNVLTKVNNPFPEQLRGGGGKGCRANGKGERGNGKGESNPRRGPGGTRGDQGGPGGTRGDQGGEGGPGGAGGGVGYFAYR